MAFDQPDSFQIGPFEVRRNPSPQELAEKLNRLREAVEQCRLQPGPGYTVSRTRGGTTLQILARPGAAPAANACPFGVTLTTASSGYTATVAPGTINGLLATNYAACAAASLSTLTGTTAATRYIMVNADTDGKELTSFSLSITSTAPTAPTPTTPLAPTTFSYPIAVVTTAPMVYQLSPCSQLGAYVFESVRVAKTLASAQDNAFDIYYHWVVR